MRRIVKGLGSTAAVLLAVFLLAAPARAQVPAVDVKLNPRIGLYTPLSSLSEAGTESFELDNSLAVGLGLEFDFAALPFGLRANLDYATASSVDLEDGSIGDTNETTLLAVVGDIVFRPLPRIVVLQPYLFAGGGLKQYDFSWEGATPAGFEDESDGTLHVGGGLDFGLGPLALNAEVGDYISWFEPEGAEDSEMQHDLFVMIGFTIGML